MFYCVIENCNTWCENLNQHYVSGEHDLIVNSRDVRFCDNCVALEQQIDELNSKNSVLSDQIEDLELELKRCKK